MSDASIKVGDKVIYKTIIYDVDDVAMECCPCIIEKSCSYTNRVNVVLLRRLRKWVEIDEVIRIPSPKK